MTERASDHREAEYFQKRRVVVTGMGMVTPLGLNVDTTWKNLIDGKSGISEVDLGYPDIQIAGIIKGFDPEIHSLGLLTKKDLNRISRPSELSLVASLEALENAGLLDENKKLKAGLDPTKIGVRIGTGIGGAIEIADIALKLSKGEKISPYSALRIEPERVGTVVSMKFGLKGPGFTPVAACASGNDAIISGCQEIEVGKAQIMVVGGVESMFKNPIGFALYDTLRALARGEKDTRTSRPFDRKRKGFVMAEGAGVLILENYEHAKKRNAVILAELIGYENNQDALSDTDPSGEGAERAMRGASEQAGKIATQGTIYINAHATSTFRGDEIEALATKKAYGRRENMFVSSTKGATGHLMGGAGAVEAIFSIKALIEGVLPPNINLDEPLAETEGLNLVPKDAQNKRVDAVVNNSFGFGGLNGVTIFAQPED